MAASPLPRDDYSGLPAWYMVQLLEPAMATLQSEHSCSRNEAAARIGRNAGLLRSYTNDLLAGRFSLVNLTVCELLLRAAGIPLATTREDMWVPLYGIRAPIRMAGDQIAAEHLPMTKDNLLAIARKLEARRDYLMTMRPRPCSP